MDTARTEFFQKLCGPFKTEGEVRTTPNGFPYVRAQTLKNRLDDVCGVDGWYPTYSREGQAVICNLSIRMPTGLEGEEWMTKSDGGGNADMVQKRDGTNVQDTENDAKSGMTSAFKRACETWGIGRYLLQCGVAEYLKPAFEGHTMPTSNYTKTSNSSYQAPAGGSSSGGGEGRTFDNFAPCQNVKGFYPWGKRLGEHYGTDVLKFVNAYGKQNNLPFRSGEWPDDHAGPCAAHVIAEIKKLPNYKGEFDKTGSTPSGTGTNATSDLSAVKNELCRVVGELGKLTNGTTPDYTWIAPAISELAQATPNVGEEIPDLAKYDNLTALKLVLEGAKMQLKMASEPAPGATPRF